MERGNLPEGASTKNAGFACFRSLSEHIADLGEHRSRITSACKNMRQMLKPVMET
ncbi:hypothetical protein [Leeuwenhoekiella marinoflava]|uniref:hypothetical protein n=1 Tax=Leeuwenhoekiella marinoflava TaxID=988 RepID=UPI0030012D69